MKKGILKSTGNGNNGKIIFISTNVSIMTHLRPNFKKKNFILLTRDSLWKYMKRIVNK